MSSKVGKQLELQFEPKEWNDVDNVNTKKFGSVVSYEPKTADKLIFRDEQEEFLDKPD